MNRIQLSQIGYVLQTFKLIKVALHSPCNLLCICVPRVTYILVNGIILYFGTKSPNLRSIFIPISLICTSVSLVTLTTFLSKIKLDFIIFSPFPVAPFCHF